MQWWHILIVVIVLIILYIISTYNKIIKLKAKVENQWSQIDIQLKRRFDLIPNLVNIVKGSTKHESETLEKVIEARNKYLTAGTPEDKMAANGELSGVMNRLFSLTESYPDLKANQEFSKILAEETETENKIAYARQFYTDAVMKYNFKIATIPTNIIAKMFGFKPEKPFAADAEERQNVKIEF